MAPGRRTWRGPAGLAKTHALPKTQWKCQVSYLKSPKKPVSPLTPGCARLRPHAGDIFSAGERFGLRQGVMRIGNGKGPKGLTGRKGGKGRKNCPIFRFVPASSGFFRLLPPSFAFFRGTPRQRILSMDGEKEGWGCDSECQNGARWGGVFALARFVRF